jgi:outer membrane protein assembly factor BamD
MNNVPLRAMKKAFGWLIVFTALCLTVACKSEFEKIRVSGNPDMILRKAFEYYDAKNYQRAQTLFELVINNVRGSKDAEKAYYQYAYCHYHLKEFVLGAYYFKNFSTSFPNSEWREEAAYLSAYCNYLQSPTYRLDQTSTLTAIEEFQIFVNLFPNSSRVEACNQRIDELRRKLEQKLFAEGELYYNLRQYQSSVLAFDNLLRDYPETPDAERVRYLIAKGDFLLSENSVIEKKEERYAETIKRCNDFLGKYPAGKYSKEVRELRKASESARKAVKNKLKNG